MALGNSSLVQFKLTQGCQITFFVQEVRVNLQKELVAFQLSEPLHPAEDLRLKLGLDLLSRLLLRCESRVQLILRGNHAGLLSRGKHSLKFCHIHVP